MKISVIIPLFNAEKYISETIISVLNQSYTNWELVIIDDGSTDQSVKIVEDFIIKDSRIRLIKKANGGQASARNIGIKQAQGNWIALLDADDLWFPEKLQRQIDIISTNPEVSVVYTGSLVLNENNTLRRKTTSDHFFNGNDKFLDLYMRSDITNSSVVIKKEVFDTVGLFNELPVFRGTEDYDMWLRLAANNFHFYRIGEALVNYRIHPAGTSQNRLRMVNGALAIFKLYDNNTNLPNRMRLKKYRQYYREKLTLIIKAGVERKEVLAVLHDFINVDAKGVVTRIQQVLCFLLPVRLALLISQLFLYRILVKLIE